MTSQLDYYSAKAALEWQVELGVDEAIGDRALNRFDEPAKRPQLKIGPASNIAPIDVIPQVLPVKEAGVDVAKAMSAKCDDLDALRNAMAVFDFCALKKGAKNLVFADGNPKADVMIIGEAPGRDEDIQGKPFVGRAGVLLDKMFAAIDLRREAQISEQSIYITNVMPWRPPQNRDPNPNEIEMMLPFLQRHVQLVAPKAIVLMGNTACSAALGKAGITRLRGTWTQAFDLPCLPMFHPAALLRDGLKKRDSWMDLLSIRNRMKETNGH